MLYETQLFIVEHKKQFFQTIGIILAAFFMHAYMESDQTSISNLYFYAFHNVNLIFHEAGHMIFMFFGDFLSTLGGSMLQILIPLIVLVPFLKIRDYFGISIVGMWLATNIFEVAVYMSDAQARVLPLLGDNPDSHDWFNLFSMMGILDRAESVGSLTLGVANFVFIGVVLYGLYGVWQREIDFFLQKKEIESNNLT